MLVEPLLIGLGTAGACISAVAILGWWLRDQFAKRDDKNAERHLQNLKKFNAIERALWALGWRENGGHVERDRPK